MMPIAYRQMVTPVGPLHAYASERYLVSLGFKPLDNQPSRPEAATRWHPSAVGSARILDALETQLGEYMAGQRTQFQLPLLLCGTAFEIKVWEGLAAIDYGSTLSYRGQALLLGQPRAVRAVASANGRNRYCIVIPCHRVIASDGSLGGYVAGLAVKRSLLDLEAKAAPSLDRGGSSRV